ncbi:hypothetical protein RR21198_3977 [Rhodococcus rhodochrous ATCC 21198]|uniref:hypothetical protein n=1 Tax=Rhodococcus aetherivorans TaxID=191292 RepID=UPI0003E22706|nr:hypothetical protein [Rhodococcus aetherivorans]ETT25237.1 hypothetical protein RR21198_3977 [Rhodococcus rhodochrous ATCC 21198]MDV6295210.1 hypothetical protein [Rhodococcus aetherivorans]NGP28491.1 hypothetical protein [Rhodococcus aetherivorans]
MDHYYKLGKQAFHNGESRNPFLNDEIAQLNEARPQVGSTLKEMTAFAKGWDAENWKASEAEIEAALI